MRAEVNLLQKMATAKTSVIMKLFGAEIWLGIFKVFLNLYSRIMFLIIP